MPETRDVGLCIGHLPGRVRPAIFVESTTTIRVLAYFRGEEEFEEFKALLGGSGLVQLPAGDTDA
jgi:hypothetical protein